MTDFDKAIEEAKAAVLPFDSWERLRGETGAAFAAFCVFRDYGPERNIIRAVVASEKDKTGRQSRYLLWRKWSMKFQWVKRADDYDQYIEKLKQAEIRKTIEAQGKVHREITGKMLQIVGKKLDTMNPEKLAQGNITDWVETAIRAEREAAGLVTGYDGKQESKQGELNFVFDFQGL